MTNPEKVTLSPSMACSIFATSSRGKRMVLFSVSLRSGRILKVILISPPAMSLYEMVTSKYALQLALLMQCNVEEYNSPCKEGLVHPIGV